MLLANLSHEHVGSNCFGEEDAALNMSDRGRPKTQRLAQSDESSDQIKQFAVE